MADPAEYLNKASEEFDSMCSKPISRAEAIIVERKLAAVLEGRKIARVLDLGCGTGGGLEMLRRITLPLEFVGIDLSQGMLERFRKKIEASATAPAAKIELVQGDMNDWFLLPRKRFDLVLSTFGSFSYIEDPGSYLLFLRENHLTEGAVLFPMVYSRLSAINLLMAQQTGDSRYLSKKRPYAFRGVDAPLHQCPEATFYTTEEIQNVMRIARMKVIEIAGLNFNSPGLTDCASSEAAVNILEREMSRETDKNKAHSLLCIAEDS